MPWSVISILQKRLKPSGVVLTPAHLISQLVPEPGLNTWPLVPGPLLCETGQANPSLGQDLMEKQASDFSGRPHLPLCLIYEQVNFYMRSRLGPYNVGVSVILWITIQNC